MSDISPSSQYIENWLPVSRSDFQIIAFLARIILRASLVEVRVSPYHEFAVHGLELNEI